MEVFARRVCVYDLPRNFSTLKLSWYMIGHRGLFMVPILLAILTGPEHNALFVFYVYTLNIIMFILSMYQGYLAEDVK